MQLDQTKISQLTKWPTSLYYLKNNDHHYYQTLIVTSGLATVHKILKKTQKQEN